MVIGIVTGNVWATRKNEKLTGIKLLIVELESSGAEQPSMVVAADNVGAGEGDRVLLTLGSAAHLAFHTLKEKPPIDAAIVGIIDGRD